MGDAPTEIPILGMRASTCLRSMSAAPLAPAEMMVPNIKKCPLRSARERASPGDKKTQKGKRLRRASWAFWARTVPLATQHPLRPRKAT